MCCHRVILPSSRVSNGPWEKRKTGRLQEQSILKGRVSYLLNLSSSSMELCLATNEHGGVCTDSPQASTETTKKQPFGGVIDWKVFGDDFCEHFSFSATTLLSHGKGGGSH